MPSQRDPRQTLKEAKQIALDHGLFVVEKADRAGMTQYLLYRCTPPNNTYVGRRATPAALRSLVCKAANYH